MKYFQNILAFAVVALVFSCDSDDEKPVVNENYFPLKKGVYQIYEVEEIVYELGEPDTFRYHLKTVVVDSFPNDRSGFTYVIHRSKKMEGEESWSYLDTWSAENDGKELVVNEENIPFVKLKFPAEEGVTWDGNAYNDVIIPSSNQHEDIYEIIGQADGLSFGSMQLGNCVRVLQEDNQEFIVYWDRRYEIYAADVGLVFRENFQLQYCTDEDCIGDQEVETGFMYKQYLREYGEE